MRLRAKVVTVIGATVHRHATIVKGSVAPGAPIPHPAWVEIDEAGEGTFYLFHYDAAGRCIADTWHATLAERAAAARCSIRAASGRNPRGARRAFTDADAMRVRPRAGVRR